MMLMTSLDQSARHRYRTLQDSMRTNAVNAQGAPNAALLALFHRALHEDAFRGVRGRYVGIVAPIRLPADDLAPVDRHRQIRRTRASQAGRSTMSPTGRPRAAAWVPCTMTPRYLLGSRSSTTHPSPNASRITVSLI